MTPLPPGPIPTPLPCNTKPNNTTCCFHQFYQPSASMKWWDWVKEISGQFPPPPHTTPSSPAIKITPRSLINVRACVCIIYLFIFSFIQHRPLSHALVCPFILQPMLWQEKLWKQERDSVRPRDHWQVGSFSLFVNEGMSKRTSERPNGWVTEREKPVNKRAPSRRARRPSWAELHLLAHSVGTAGDSLWAAEGRLSQVPVHRGAVTTWIGFVQSQVVQSQEDHAGKIPN